jgi:hypothetical protein
MVTLLSYAPGDFLMFGPEVYWRLFELQNTALWPAPVIAALLGLLALPVLIRGHPLHIRGVLVLFALACLGAAQFLAARYAPINWPVIYAAWGFGAQAALLAVLAVVGPVQGRAEAGGTGGLAGWMLLVHAAMLHPFTGIVFGRPLAQAEIAGIAPDPTAIACLGLVTLVRPGLAGLVLGLVPALWCVLSAATLLTLGEAQGWVPLGAALVWLLGQCRLPPTRA